MKKILALIYLLLAILTIFGAFYLVARYYLSFYPPLGNDYYHSFNLIQFLKDNFTWPQLSWRYIWHFGGPAIIAYPWLNFYLVQPVISIFGLYNGTSYYFLGSIFLYGLVSFFLFLRMSKSLLLSLGLAVSLIWSANTWRLISAGSLTLTVNQFLLALGLFLIVVYLESKKRKYLLLSAFIGGLSVLSQSGSAYPFIIPTIILVILFWWPNGEKFWQIRQKIVDCFIFGITTICLSSFYLYYMIGSVLGARGSLEVFDWMKTEAFSSIITKTNPSLLILVAVFFLILLAVKGLNQVKTILPFLVVFIYLIVFNFLSINGLNPFGASLAPAENWFISTLMIAVMVSVLWQGIRQKLAKNLTLVLLLLSFILLIAPFGYWQVKEALKSFDKQNLVCGTEDADAVHKALVKNDYSGLAQAFPSWFDRNNVNWRFFSLSWCVDLWWNTFSKMPTTGGYDTLLLGKNANNYLSWMHVLFSTAEPFEKISKNNAFFLIDWFGGRYIEKTAELSYLDDPEIIKLENSPPGYRVFEFNSGIVSPIIRPTNVPVVLVVSPQNNFDTLLRVLAQENLNSQYIIPVQGSPYIDDLVKEKLDDFDAILLYGYQYKNDKEFHNYPLKPWEKLATYVKNGGTLIIETGNEVKEADMKNLPGLKELPEVFPVAKTKREELGMAWQSTAGESQLWQGIDRAKFSPLDYDGSPWKLSVSDSKDLRPWARVELSQKGNPVIVSGTLGKGKVIWSGMTLLYHIQAFQNLEESRFFRKILESTVGIEQEKIPPFDFVRDQSEKIKVTAQDFKGILFKENYNTGWQAKTGEDNLKIYKAGMGFMYVKMANKNRGEKTVMIDFKGEGKYIIMFYLSFATTIFIVAYFFLGEKVIKKGQSGTLKGGKTSWLGKEDE